MLHFFKIGTCSKSKDSEYSIVVMSYSILYLKALITVLKMITLVTAPEAAASTRGNTASLILQGGEKLQTIHCLTISSLALPGTTYH